MSEFVSANMYWENGTSKEIKHGQLAANLYISIFFYESKQTK